MVLSDQKLDLKQKFSFKEQFVLLACKTFKFAVL